jgi:hypothetical protein
MKNYGFPMTVNEQITMTEGEAIATKNKLTINKLTKKR